MVAALFLLGGGAVLATTGTNISFPKARATFAGDVKVQQNHSADVVMAENIFAPGTHSGWHAHPGTTVILVKTGSIAIYTLQPNGTCVRKEYAAGQGFVEEGGALQIGKNEGSVETDVWVTFLNVPTGGSNRIDLPANLVPNDPSCPAS
jgi:hypothetical protein